MDDSASAAHFKI